MLEPPPEPLLQRLHKLNAAINSSGINSGDSISPMHLLAREGLLDALLVLYDECNNETLKKTPFISKFVEKYRSAIHEVRRLRLSLNDFEQKKIIGKGHFGVVQVVREKQTGNVYALKILQKAKTLAQQHVTFYEEERDIMAKATSPWITHLQFAFQDENNLYLLMDFHPGGDLLSLLDRYNYIFPEEMAQFYLAEITVAIQAVHTMGYVHRDVKPDNILIDRCGHLKLADFGSAAKLMASKIVRSKMPVGTPDYIAPEILTSMNKEPDRESTYGPECDFWSLGVMAYEMLYGETPFKSDNAVATYNNIMNYEKTLTFTDTDENEVSSAAKDLIRGLLSSAQQRLDYAGIVKHKFFFRTDWNDLESVEPPFIPVVTSVDDTSNFEEFEYQKSPPSVEAFLSKPVFSGRQLPFVGFTYNRSSTHQDTSHTMSTSQAIVVSGSLNSTTTEGKDSAQLESELKAKKRELHEAQLKMEALQGDQKRRSESNQVERRAAKAEKKVSLLEEEIENLRRESVESSHTIQRLKGSLASEKSERSKTEAKTLEFLRAIKQKWKKEEEEKIKHLTEKVELYKKTAESLDEHKDEAVKQLRDMTVELNRVEAQALKYKQLLKEKSETNVPKEEVKTDASTLQASLEESQKQFTEQRKKNEELSAQVNKMKEVNDQLMEMNSEKEGRLGQAEYNLKTAETAYKQLMEELSRWNKKVQVIQANGERKEMACAEEHRELQVKLSQERDECRQLRIQVQELSSSMNESLATQSSSQSEIESLRCQLKTTEEEMERVARDKEQLTHELSDVSTREDEQRVKIMGLESLLESLKETLNRLGKQNEHEGDKTRLQKTEAQLELLEKQLKTSQEAAAVDKEKLHSTEEALKKLRREASDLKLDLRSCERELKQSQETLTFLRERSREAKDQLKQKEDELIKCQSEKAEVEEKLEKKDAEIMIHQKKQEEKEAAKQELSVKISEHEKELKQWRMKVEDLQRNIVSLQNEVEKVKIEKRSLESELRNGERNLERTKDSSASLQNTIKELEAKLAHSDEVIQNLKEVCCVQDDQLATSDKFEEKLEIAAREKTSLTAEIQKLQSELKMSKTDFNGEKSLRLFQEKRVKDLEAKLATVDQDLDQQKINTEERVQSLMGEIGELQNQVSSLENAVTDSAQRERTFEHTCSELKSQMELMKDEISGHIHHIHSLKESNFKLTDGLEEAILKGETFKLRINELEKELSHTRSASQDQEVKLQSTMAQQTKLIDFLQSKVENPPKKKAVLSRLLGGGTRTKAAGGYMVGHQYRKMEESLAREKAHTAQLAAQLKKAHAKIVQLKAQGSSGVGGSPKHRNALENISNSPQYRSNQPKERMKHKIPHRWQSSLVMRAGECGGCLGSIPFSSNAVKCQECGVLAHTKCSKNIANTCGLPEAFADHFTKSQNTTASPDKAKSRDDRKCAIQGWVKVLRSGEVWDKWFAVLTQNELNFYKGEHTSSLQPVKTINFSNAGQGVAIFPSVPMSELPDLSPADFPYVLKMSWRDRAASSASSHSTYILTSTFEEKQRWKSALEQALHNPQDDAGLEVEEEEGEAKGCIEVECLMSLSTVTPIDVNTIVFLDDKTTIVGAVEGLFSFSRDASGKLSFRARIDGVSSVYDIVLVESVGVAAFIAGKDNYVYHTDLALLKVAAEASQMGKPSISLVSVDPAISCHLVSVSSQTKRVFMFAAASSRISIFVWDDKSRTFEVCRQYSTQEPCSCFQFTANSLIVGAERFYKISLKNFVIEEYLDESDTSLGYAIYGSAHMSSFPVAIIQVSGSSKHEEYLLIFYEFGVFVDASGRRSREFDLKFVRLPIQIVYRAPYLYILHHNAVEVVEIRAESFTKIRGVSFDSDTECAPTVRSAHRKIDKPRYLGKNIDSTSIVIATTSDKCTEVSSLNAVFPVDPDESFTCTTLDMSTPSQRLDAVETASVCSEMSVSSSTSDAANASFKRSVYPNFMRASKRTKQQSNKTNRT